MEALKKQQLGIMTEYDELVIDSVELSIACNEVMCNNIHVISCFQIPVCPAEV